ncbi:hypothetical protein [Streptomyces sp. Z26]|uniref:hypothetical protein n=1 Tax=Streptomyces TaxID=1883 RepID=UPI0026CE95AB
MSAIIETVATVDLTDHSVVASCLPQLIVGGTGVSGVSASGGLRLGGNERPTTAPAAVAAQAQAYASVFAAANGAGEGRQKKQQYTMWAFRGHDPWRDPA